MAQYNVQLKGWHALLAIVALLAFGGVKVWLRIRPVEDGMRDAIRTELLNEFSGRGRKDVARLVAEARQGLPIEPVPPVVQRDVEFTSIAARGEIGARETVVRAEITVDGSQPPDSRPIRYFRLTPKYGGGWEVLGETDSYRYFMELWP